MVSCYYSLDWPTIPQMYSYAITGHLTLCSIAKQSCAFSFHYLSNNTFCLRCSCSHDSLRSLHFSSLIQGQIICQRCTDTAGLELEPELTPTSEKNRPEAPVKILQQGDCHCQRFYHISSWRLEEVSAERKFSIIEPTSLILWMRKLTQRI